jgi:alpha-L-rhamnosidase
MRELYRIPDRFVTSLFSASRKRRVRIALAGATLVVLAAMGTTAVAAPPASSDGWITHPEAASTPVVLQFRRELNLPRVPRSLPVTVTADNRFVLYVNGTRVASGPSTATAASWRYSKLELAPHLKRGDNVIAAVVWNFGEAAPLAQISIATGFRMTGAGVSTAVPGWRVTMDAGRTAVNGRTQIDWQYYVASAPEVIDARKANWDWMGPDEGRSRWRDAVAAPAAAQRVLVEDPLPPQDFRPTPAGTIVRSSLAGAEKFPASPAVIPPNTTTKLLLRRDAMISGYPALEVSGGRDATIRLEYGEALYDADRRKADRDLVGDRQVVGFFDTYIADGEERSFAPLWWRTFRYIELDVTTAGEALTLRGMRIDETGYPFNQVAQFQSNDAELDRIWNIGWRTLRVDAHETFMDSSYWEQLQYTGDTRLEMLITYAVTGDPRLARQAIEAFASSDVDGGLMQGAFPSRGNNVIATFSFAWVGMLSDWALEQPDTALIRRHLPRVRKILQWFEPRLNPQGLLGKNPQWNFIDWAGQRWDDRDTFPSWGKENGSCLMTAMWLGALRQAAELEMAYGDPAQAKENYRHAQLARRAIREHCWSAERGLFADDGDRTVFSQHMNVFAVLYDIADRDEMRPILERITMAGKGIDAPAGMYTSTYYFAWYLVRAFEHAGLQDRYFALLQTWRDLLKLNYTTWPESRGDTRSDTHAWSAHPTADLLGLVAGIRPAAAGYSRLRVAPALGHLTSLDATAATPHGPVTVRYRVANGRLAADITRPSALPGEFVWLGKSYLLTRTRTRLDLPAGR